MTNDAPADTSAEHKKGGEAQEAEQVPVQSFDPASYSGPIQTAGSNSVSWGGRATYQAPRPDGNRYAQSQWQFTMSGAIGQEAPHAAYFSLNNEQQNAFDAPGRPPFNFFSQAAGGGARAPSIPIEQRVIEIEASASPQPPPPAQTSCSQCGSNSSSIKKLRTPGGLMRALCNNCVYDLAGGDQEVFTRLWAGGSSA